MQTTTEDFQPKNLPIIIEKLRINITSNYNKKRDRGKSLGTDSQLAGEHPTEINKDISSQPQVRGRIKIILLYSVFYFEWNAYHANLY